MAMARAAEVTEAPRWERAGLLASGAEVLVCRLRNRAGVEAEILSLGATLRALRVPDAGGGSVDLVLGPETLDGYLEGRDCFGSTVGRFANRIAGGRLVIAGRTYALPVNAPPHTEHGGAEGFDRRLWTPNAAATADGVAELALTSADGDQGFPGTLDVVVCYALSEASELRIDYRAVTQASTVVNLTNHTYWNLAGSGSALEAVLTLDADFFLPIDATALPTGAIRGVAGTAFDFRTPAAVGARIRDGGEPQLVLGRGYDHCFEIGGPPGTLRRAARLADPRTGRAVEVLTTEPGLQLYSGNWLTGAVVGKGRHLYRAGDGIALEAQHFPDSPNRPAFPSTLLEPGQMFTSTTVYRLEFANAAHAP